MAQRRSYEDKLRDLQRKIDERDRRAVAIAKIKQLRAAVQHRNYALAAIILGELDLVISPREEGTT